MMMKKAAVLSLVTLAVVGCGPTRTEVQETRAAKKEMIDNQPERVETLHEGGYPYPGYELIIVEIDGRDMECVLMEKDASSSSIGGLSCNWDAIND